MAFSYGLHSPDSLQSITDLQNPKGATTLDDFRWADTVLATWGKPKETSKVDLPKIELPKVERPKAEPKVEQPKVEFPTPEQKDKWTQAGLEKLWKQMQPPVYIDRNVKEIEFSNGDRLKLGGPEGWTLTDKNGKKVTIGEDLNKGMSTLYRYRLSNGAIYTVGCFNSGISYPNGDSISFGMGRHMRGGKVVA